MPWFYGTKNDNATTKIVKFVCTNRSFFCVVNHTNLTSATHEEAINILRNSGSELTLTIKHYKSAAPFLLKNFRQLIPETEQIFPGKKKNWAKAFTFIPANVIHNRYIWRDSSR
jgi:hypothetical protein